jgi:hypothetical protein
MIDLKSFCGSKKTIVSTGKVFDLSKPVSYGGWIYACDNTLAIRVPTTPILSKPDTFPDAAKLFPAKRPTRLVKYPVGGCNICPTCEQVRTRDIGKNWRIARQVEQRILTLPNVRISIPKRASDGMYFKFDGGEGVAMGVRK